MAAELEAKAILPAIGRIAGELTCLCGRRQQRNYFSGFPNNADADLYYLRAKASDPRLHAGEREPDDASSRTISGRPVKN